MYFPYSKNKRNYLGLPTWYEVYQLCVGLSVSTADMLQTDSLFAGVLLLVLVS